MKFYEDINDVSYDHDSVLKKLCESDLISKRQRQSIESQQDDFDKNR